MARLGKIACSAVFVLLICAPGMRQAFHIPVKPLLEKRLKAPLPYLSFGSLWAGTFMLGFDKYYDDHVGFRDAMIRINNEIDLSIFRVSPNPKVIMGKHGWLFWHETVRDFEYVPSPDTDRIIAALCHSLSTFSEALRQRGVGFLFVIAPNKAAIYGEFMPDRYKRHPGPDFSSRLVQELRRQGKVHVLNVKDTLQSHKGQALLYEKRGTHWNPLGAFYAAREILEYLGSQYDLACTLPQRVEHSYTTVSPDLARMVEGLRTTDEIAPAPKVGPEAFGGRTLPATLCYADSFIVKLTQYLLPNFSSIEILDYRSQPMASTLEARLPGVRLVLLVAAEREVRMVLPAHDFPDVSDTKSAPHSAQPTQ